MAEPYDDNQSQLGWLYSTYLVHQGLALTVASAFHRHATHIPQDMLAAKADVDMEDVGLSRY